jgi:Zn-dependent protease
MVLFTFSEIFDIIIMTVVVGYIFSDLFKKPAAENYDPLTHFKTGFDIENLKFAAMVTAPAIILHELGHRFVALGFGLEAHFQAAWLFLGLALAMKLMNFGFIFIVPAYVSILGRATPLEFSLIAFAGPAINLILWLVAYFALKKNLFPRKYDTALGLTSKINMFLFIFNMLPIPGFDGSKVFTGLIQVFF